LVPVAKTRPVLADAEAFRGQYWRRAGYGRA
jgi:hypothetical protein